MMAELQFTNEVLQYLVDCSTENGANKLPSLSAMSKELGVSVAYLREQLEVAKAIGLVDVRPRTGIRRLPFSFLPAVRQSASYAIALDSSIFGSFLICAFISKQHIGMKR